MHATSDIDTGTQAPDPTPAPQENDGSRAEALSTSSLPNRRSLGAELAGCAGALRSACSGVLLFTADGFWALLRA